MRTNIDIDDELMRQAMAATNTTTKKAAVEASLELVVRLKRQGEALEGLHGLALWRGPDDDWFATDEEVLAKRAQVLAEEEALHASQGEPQEARLVSGQGHR